MSRVLGVSCSKSGILLAVVDAGEVRARPDLVEPASLLAAGEALEAMLDTLVRTILTTEVRRVRLLLPEASVRYRHPDISPRVAHETVVRLAALRAGVELEELSRPDARRRLGLSAHGAFEGLLSEAVLGPPVGRHWSTGRKLAVAAALAEA